MPVTNEQQQQQQLGYVLTVQPCKAMMNTVFTVIRLVTLMLTTQTRCALCATAGTLNADGLTDQSGPPVVARAYRRVSWKAQQLAEVIEDVTRQEESYGLPTCNDNVGNIGLQSKTPFAGTLSTEAVAGSPFRELDVSAYLTSEKQRRGSDRIDLESSNSSGMLTDSPSRRSVDRMISPFALTPAPSRF